MFKISVDQKQLNIIEMGYMQPGDMGVILDKAYKGHYVMRTLCETKFEVMDLTKASLSACWTSRNDIQVQLLPKGTQITFTVS